jgi:hypothetical protein
LARGRGCGSGTPLNIGETLFQLLDSIKQDPFAQVIHRPGDLRTRSALLTGICLLSEGGYCQHRAKQ